MATHTRHTRSFIMASVLSAPFVLLLLAVAFLAGTSSSTPEWLAISLLYAYVVISGPVGVVATLVTWGAVAFAFLHRNGSKIVLALLVIYAAVLACYSTYLLWWYGTGQRLDLP